VTASAGTATAGAAAAPLFAYPPAGRAQRCSHVPRMHSFFLCLSLRTTSVTDHLEDITSPFDTASQLHSILVTSQLHSILVT
jgi:hypothetical protein